MSKKVKVLSNTPSPDITGRKRAEEQTGEIKELYREMIELSPDCIVTVDTKGMITLCNAEATRLLGYSKDELVGKHFSKLGTLRLRDIPRYLKVFRSVLVGRVIEPIEVPFYRKDGVTRLVSVRVSRLKVSGKTIIQTTARDITGRKQAEELIQQQNKFLTDIFESLTHPFYIVDANDYTIKMANRAAKLGDLSKASTCYALTHKKDKPCASVGHVCPLEEVKKTRKPVVVEHIHYDKDGNLRNIEVHGYPIIDTKGNVIRMIEYSLDITERKQMEEALRESEEKFRTFMESASDLMLIADKDGNITYVNESMAGTLRYSKEELIGMRITQILTKEALEKDFKPNWDKFITSGEISLDTTFATKDGKEIYGEQKVVAIYDSDGKYAGSRAVFRDLTERKRMEHDLRERVKELQCLYGIACCQW